MKVLLNKNIIGTAFKGTTAIRAVTDSHQEARAESAFLSKIAKDAEKQNNILLLNAGDLFGGVYSRDLMSDLYIQFKKSHPNVEVVMTIGNNDFISVQDKYAPKNPTDKRSPIQFFKDTIKDFEENGINVVCANVKDKDTGKYPDWIKPYTIVERDGDRLFVTGFCVDRLPNKALNIDVISQTESFDELKSAIEAEQPDSIIVLNHDYANTSRQLFDYAKKQGIKIDLIVGGHDHDNPKVESDINLYFPKTFSKSMFEMDLKIRDNIHRLLNIKEVSSDGLPISNEFEAVVKPYEEKSGILDKVAPHVLNLPKFYAHPGSLGTFIADGIKDISGVDAAFFASNVVRVPLYYKEGADILNYDTRKIITFDSTVQRADLSVEALKEVLNSALESRLKLGEQNARFLQCSSNIKIFCEGNSSDKSYVIKQIFLNEEPLLDDNGNPIDSERIISCAFDNYIPTDGRSASLANASKENVLNEQGSKLRIDEVLKRQLQSAVDKYPKGMTYPKFVLEETIL
ncbi:MAG: metallophosphoesterase [Candidatus Gastranaerophilales bacterium]|nr:metallophosphoesterase [Candidatus Gastranaerophilales bacterium]